MARPTIIRLIIWSFAFFLASITAFAQFKVIGPAPYPPAVARQKIKALFEGMDAANRPQTIQTLSGLLSWYRDIVDDEMIAAWHKDGRANLTGSIETLADARVASSLIEFSWREQRDAGFLPAYASMFGNLMTRFPESAGPFLDDLLGPASSGGPMPALSPAAAETVCRILLDMPDVGSWRRDAVAIVPHYRRAAESLLDQDLHGGNPEKSFQAQRWRGDLKLDPAETNRPASAREQPSLRSRPGRPAVSAPAETLAPARPAVVAPVPDPVPPGPVSYNGPRSGTLETSGILIPQNAEYVFRDVPLTNIQLDYDHKVWEARLAPEDGHTQRLIVKNKSSGPQKRCVVHWSVVP